MPSTSFFSLYPFWSDYTWVGVELLVQMEDGSGVLDYFGSSSGKQKWGSLGVSHWITFSPFILSSGSQSFFGILHGQLLVIDHVEELQNHV